MSIWIWESSCPRSGATCCFRHGGGKFIKTELKFVRELHAVRRARFSVAITAWRKRD